MACELIESGHNRVTEYGYSYFLEAYAAHIKIQFEKNKSMAVAFRMARFADKHEWRRYMKRKSPGFRRIIGPND